ncbi:hypothetical protein C8Q77DRAFT_1157846 [Trametes polyzona]|nr:hypothetical protein C8Q77DRAFT_1157846 [Trametes polyzona]
MPARRTSKRLSRARLNAEPYIDETASPSSSSPLCSPTTPSQFSPVSPSPSSATSVFDASSPPTRTSPGSHDLEPLDVDTVDTSARAYALCHDAYCSFLRTSPEVREYPRFPEYAAKIQEKPETFARRSTPPTFDSSPSEVEDLSPDDDISRPRNAFVIFRQSMFHFIFKDEKISPQKVGVPLLSKVCGCIWRAAKRDGQSPLVSHFFARSHEVEAAHKRAYPNYKYSPQTKEAKAKKERKRRKSGRKARAAPPRTREDKGKARATTPIPGPSEATAAEEVKPICTPSLTQLAPEGQFLTPHSALPGHAASQADAMPSAATWVSNEQPLTREATFHPFFATPQASPSVQYTAVGMAYCGLPTQAGGPSQASAGMFALYGPQVPHAQMPGLPMYTNAPRNSQAPQDIPIDPRLLGPEGFPGSVCGVQPVGHGLPQATLQNDSMPPWSSWNVPQANPQVYGPWYFVPGPPDGSQ